MITMITLTTGPPPGEHLPDVPGALLRVPVRQVTLGVDVDETHGVGAQRQLALSVLEAAVVTSVVTADPRPTCSPRLSQGASSSCRAEGPSWMLSDPSTASTRPPQNPRICSVQ